MASRQPFSLLVSVLLAAWTLLAAAQMDSDVTSIPLRTHSLSTPYIDTALHPRWWDFGGSTIIRPDQYVRLTSQQPSQAGWLYSRVPLTATNWEVEVEFSISGTGSLFGDGMAMWVTKDKAEMGTVFGMKDKFEGLGLFFDTYKNNRPGVVFPYVVAMVGDGQTSYDQANDGKANQLDGCSARGIRNSEIPTKAKVTYFQDKSLVVELMYKQEDEWTPCIDVQDVKLPSVSYLGFSAETGELSDNHDILKVETKNLYSPSGRTKKPVEQNTGKGKSKKGKINAATSSSSGEGGSWTWFFLKFVLFGLALALAYAGFVAYRARTRDRF